MAAKPSGRVTPRKNARVPAKPAKAERWEVQDSKSVRSGWVWRGFLMLALFGIGVVIIMGANHHPTLAILWAVISAGWFAVSMWLWRQHTRYVRKG